jgi:IMP cyclohydrolase
MKKILGDGSYPGRVVGVGRTKSGKPLAIYAVTGRSEMSKMRKAVIVGNNVEITPLGKLTPEQEANRDLIIYRAMSVNRADRTLVLSNGKQTDPIFHLTCYYSLGLYDSIYSTMYTMGFEPDSLKTPRLAGLILPKPIIRRILATVVADETQPEGKQADVAFLDSGSAGQIEFIATYTGSYDKPQSPVLNWHKDWIYSTQIEEDSAEAIAQEVYDALDDKVRVATIAAVLEHDGWMIDVCNLYS